MIDEEKQARRLPIHQTRWLFGYRALHIPISDSDDLPVVGVVLDQKTGAIRASNLDLPAMARDVRAATALLFDAILRPVARSGPPCRPREVAIEDAQLYSALQPLLERIGVQASWERSIPALDTMARTAERAMRRATHPPAMSRAPGVTRVLLTEFYSAAAEFYGAFPWKWLGSADPIAVRYPEDAEPVFVMLVAGETEHPGLNVCLSREDLERCCSEGEMDEQTANVENDVPVLILFYADASTVAPKDLQAIKRLGLTIRDERAYPLFARADPGEVFSCPSPEDIWRMAAFLRTLPEFIHTVGFDTGWVQDTHHVYQLPEVYPERSVALTYPYDLPPGEYVPGEPYAEVIDGWCRDPSQYPFASHLAIFMAQILRTLHAQGYSQATIDQYARSFEAIGWLLCQYGSYDALTRDLFQGAPQFEDEFRREISSAKTALQQYRRAWRMLGRWAYELDEAPLNPAVPDASASVES